MEKSMMEEIVKELLLGGVTLAVGLGAFLLALAL